MLDPLFHDKLMWRLSNCDFERLPEMMGAQSCNRSEFNERELVSQMRVDVIKDAP